MTKADVALILAQRQALSAAEAKARNAEAEVRVRELAMTDSFCTFSSSIRKH